MGIGVFLAIFSAVLVVMLAWMIWMIKYNTKRRFMVDELSKYGGTITYQGIQYRISRDAVMKVGYGTLTVTNPDGTMTKFVLGGALA